MHFVHKHPLSNYHDTYLGSVKCFTSPRIVFSMALNFQQQMFGFYAAINYDYSVKKQIDIVATESNVCHVSTYRYCST